MFSQEMELVRLIQCDETTAQQNLEHPSFTVRSACVKAWESCAFKALYLKDSALRMVAIESHFAVANQIFEQALALNNSFELVKCAFHQSLAERLYTHHNSMVRAVCASKWYQLALVLFSDEDEHVRNACCVWPDIARSLIQDPSPKIVSLVVTKFEDLALDSTTHPDPLVRLHCALNWLSSAKRLTNDDDLAVCSAAYRTIQMQGAVVSAYN